MKMVGDRGILWRRGGWFFRHCQDQGGGWNILDLKGWLAKRKMKYLGAERERRTKNR